MADQNYVFISYKGDDPEALEIIRRIRDDGYRVWYDQRLLPSEQWASEISRRIKGCGYFVTLLTDAFLRSEWCAKELTLAQMKKKPILAVHLAKNELPDGVDLILADLYGVYRSACKSEENFYHQIYKAKGFDAFRTKPVKEALPTPVSEPAQKPAAPAPASRPAQKPAAPAPASRPTAAAEKTTRTIHYPSGGSYTGETRNDRPDGFGTMSYSFGDYQKRDYYTGEWKAGQRHGKGKLVYRNGMVKDGLWENGAFREAAKSAEKPAASQPQAASPQPQPAAKPAAATSEPKAPEKEMLTYEDGSIYFGEVLDDEPNGVGTMTYPSNDRWRRKEYTGAWRDGLRHGKGRMVWTFGDVYDGDWVNGQMSGKGKYQYADGRRYTGDWKDGKQHGRGIFRDAKGMVYDGPFANGMQEGVFTVYPSLNPGAARKVSFHRNIS